MIERCKESDGYFLIKERCEDYTDKMIANYIKEKMVMTENQLIRDKLQKYWRSEVWGLLLRDYHKIRVW